MLYVFARSIVMFTDRLVFNKKSFYAAAREYYYDAHMVQDGDGHLKLFWDISQELCVKDKKPR